MQLVWALAALALLGLLLGSRTALAYVKGIAQQIRLTDIGGGFSLQADAAQAFQEMRDAAAADGVTLKVDSAFRSMEEQQSLWDQKQAGTLSQAVAKPGFSNHQSGIAVDIDTQAETYGKFQGPVFEWLADHAGEYGFDNAEGRSVGEPWHWVYTATSSAGDGNG